jgi:DNA-binding NarL/FixJ family response regulator
MAQALARRPAGDDRRQLAVLVTATLAQILTGEPDAALVDIGTGLVLLDEGADTALPLVRTRLLLNRRLALSLLGRLQEAEDLARSSYRDAVAEACDEITGAWALSLAIAVLERGRVEEAEQVLREAVADLTRQDPLELMPLAVALRAYVATQAGDLGAARSALAEHDDRWGTRPAHAHRSWLGRARAWVAALAGDRDAMLQHLHETLEDNRLTGELGWSPAALHDAARLGEAEAVTEELAALATARNPSPLVVAWAAHCRAVIDDSGTGLEAAGRQLADAGADLLAAEALNAAAGAHRRAGDEAAARRAAVRCQMLADRCRGAATPGLREHHEQLTPRELQVARLAASGWASREIAEQLHVSVRTVDNHLYRVYEKLHLEGREQLRNVLGALTG